MSETMVFRFHDGQSLRATIECEAPLYYNLRDTAGNPLVVSRDRVREIVPLADVDPCPDAFSGAATDPGHSWNGDACSLCGKSRSTTAPAPTPPVPANTTDEGEFAVRWPDGHLTPVSDRQHGLRAIESARRAEPDAVLLQRSCTPWTEVTS